MRSPYNPRSEDITAWAYDGDSFEPVQDWDLALSHCPYESLYMKLATATDCPKQGYFLALLYLMVGDAVRTQYRARSREDVERLLGLAEKNSKAHSLRLWVKRSRELMANPKTFDYKDWCGGGLAKEE